MIATVIDTLRVPIARAGRPFIAAFAGVTLLAFAFVPALGWPAVALTLWCTYFFRDPHRLTPVRAGLVVSPADGLVQTVGPAVPPPELGLSASALTRISVFMNVFDVHVNRSPVDGTVRRVAYTPGTFVNASLDKASENNERNGLVIATADGRELGVVQIAGLVARRIVCRVAEGQALRGGERIGMIRFGSRVDVYLPNDVAPLVGPGQRAIAGETVLADLDGAEPARLVEVR